MSNLSSESLQCEWNSLHPLEGARSLREYPQLDYLPEG